MLRTILVVVCFMKTIREVTTITVMFTSGNPKTIFRKFGPLSALDFRPLWDSDCGSGIMCNRRPICGSNLVTYESLRKFKIAKKINPDIKLLHIGNCKKPTKDLKETSESDEIPSITSLWDFLLVTTRKRPHPFEMFAKEVYHQEENRRLPPLHLLEYEKDLQDFEVVFHTTRSPETTTTTTTTTTFTTTTTELPIIIVRIETTDEPITELPVTEISTKTTAHPTTKLPVTVISIDENTAQPTTTLPVTGMSSQSTTQPTTKRPVTEMSIKTTAQLSTKFPVTGISIESTAKPTTTTEKSIETTTKPFTQLNGTTQSVETEKEHFDIDLNDIFISVKTTTKNQHKRLHIIFKTWFQLAMHQTWFFSDGTHHKVFIHNETFTNQHVINTNCSSSHSLIDLCCKTSVELDYFYKSRKRWFCHFDDDNYVNVPRLVEVLQEYDPEKDWYLGRVSRNYWHTIHKTKFQFATFGAGVCITRGVLLKIYDYFMRVPRDKNFLDYCVGTNVPDDVSFGSLIALAVRQNLTQLDGFHSHYEKLEKIRKKTFAKQISFSYGHDYKSIIKIDNGFPKAEDPTRFLSLHCYLFPYFSYCPK